GRCRRPWPRAGGRNIDLPLNQGNGQILAVATHDELRAERADLPAPRGHDEWPTGPMGNVEEGLAALERHPATHAVIADPHARCRIEMHACAIVESEGTKLADVGRNRVAMKMVDRRHDREGRAG